MTPLMLDSAWLSQVCELLTLFSDPPHVPGLRHEEALFQKLIELEEEAVRANVPKATLDEWIAKMDADDLLLPHRFEAQLAALEDTGVDLCGAAMWEFDDDPERPTRLRTNPTTHDEIARRIIEGRPYQTVDDLRRVKGIGDKRLEGIRPYVTER